MSNKSARKVTLPKPPPVPRSLDEIKNEYAQRASDAGQRQYEIFIKEAELVQLNEMLRSLNQEASARIQLDEQAKAAAPTPESTNA